MTSIGRNDPCPCGSGLKYKRCCILKLVSASADETGPYSDRDRDSAIRKLDRFLRCPEFREFYDRTAEAIWSGAPEEMSDEDLSGLMHSPAGWQAFFPYAAFDARLESGETLTDVLVREQGSTLSKGERAFLDCSLRAHLRLYEIMEVRLNEGFRLRDLLTGAEEFVHERAATTQLTTWTIIAARVIEGPRGVPVFDTIPCAFPPILKEHILRMLRSAKRRALDSYIGVDETKFFKWFAPVIQAIWLQEVAFRPLPKMSTTDGEPVAFVKSVFDVYDHARMRAALEAASDVEVESPETFVWIDRDGSRLLGSFRLTAKRLVYEGMSEARARSARSFIERIAGDAVMYRATSVESAEQAMRRYKERGAATAPSDLGPAEEAEVIRGFYDDHYRKWLDIPVPALGDRTPRHAAKLKTVRPMLIALIKDLESDGERARREGRPGPDVSWMWSELGLSRDEASVPVVDQRPPIERLEGLLKERKVSRRKDLLHEIRREIAASGAIDEWMKAVSDLEARGTMSANVGALLSFLFAEELTGDDATEDGELVRISNEMEAIERAHGLKEDEHWLVSEAPDDWRSLSEAWSGRADALIVQRLRACGRADLAEMFVQDQAAFDEMHAAGRAELFARRKR